MIFAWKCGSREGNFTWCRLHNGSAEGLGAEKRRGVVCFAVARQNAERSDTGGLGSKFPPPTLDGEHRWRIADLDREIMFRTSAERAETKMRQPSVRMGRALLAHMRRCRAIDERARQEETYCTGEPSNNFLAVVHWKGRPIKDIGKSFVTAMDYAGLPLNFTPHILRHTRVTWWVAAGLPIEEVADAAGMTTEMV